MSYDASGRRVLVTGATAGIGEATARLLCQAGADEVIVTGRRRKRLEALAEDLEEASGASVRPVAFDVRNRDAIDALVDEKPSLLTVDVLVNNAGLARGKDPLHAARVEDWEEMIDTNVKGLLYMTRRVLPAMVEREDGHVVNVGSSSGRWIYPGGTVYCATKFAVRAITEGTRMDVHGSNVRVTNIEPGIVDTEFSDVRFRGDTEQARSVYEDTRALLPEDIADAIVWSITRPEHVNMQEIVVYPTDQADPRMIHREDARGS